MIFSSGIFLFFFAVVFLVQWYFIARIPGEDRRRNALFLFLLLVSYLFYMSWDWRFGFLILFSTFVDYWAGIYIHRHGSREHELREVQPRQESRSPEGIKENSENGAEGTSPLASSTATEDSDLEDQIRIGQRKARVALTVSLLVNLCSLGTFKYFHFFADSFHALMYSLDPGFGPPSEHQLLFKIILPVGISFFTFQSMSYTIDVYRKVIPVERSFLKFALFVSFFPQLVAGPIVTAREFLPQLARFPRVDSEDLREGSRIFLLGFIKKSVLADSVAPYADMVHADPLSFGFYAHWLAGIAFTMQLYLDFSGYSDMAIGSARLLGFHLPENFRLPYLSGSISEHWQRWHISLSRWFRDYLYIPLGGNRVGPARHKVNLFAVMATSGLWHGAAWTYVLWGMTHGLALVLEAILKPWMGALADRFRRLGTAGEATWRYMGWAYQILFVTIFNTVLFRAEDIGNAWPIFKRLLALEGSMAMDIRPTHYRTVFLVLLAMIVGHWLGKRFFSDQHLRSPLPGWAETLALPFVLVLLTQLAVLDQTTFIYFAF